MENLTPEIWVKISFKFSHYQPKIRLILSLIRDFSYNGVRLFFAKKILILVEILTPEVVFSIVEKKKKLAIKKCNIFW